MCWAFLVTSGCSQSNAPVSGVNRYADGSSFQEVVGPDDLFEVRVFGEPEMSSEYRVSSDGSIDFPFCGRIVVSGLRPGQIQELITDKLKAGYLIDPQVSVLVREWNSRKISILGQVKKPGPVDYFPRMTVVDAIAAAGGFTPIASKNNVTLRREVDGDIHRSVVKVDDISGGRSANIVLAPGDVIVVDERLF